MSLKSRVVITGLGLVTPLGIGVYDTWKPLCDGKSGISHITKFDTSGFETRIAGEVKNFVASDFLPKKEANRIESFAAYAYAAAKMALDDSSIKIVDYNPERIGVIIGCGLGGLSLMENMYKLFLERGPRKITPFLIPMMIGNIAAGLISIHFGTKGPSITISTACAAGTHAIGDAYKMIRYGDVDIAIAGGTESLITPLCIAGFNAMNALSTKNDQPEKASRPFDKNRDGFVIGEGAGIVIMEKLELALQRKAHIYSEICGFGMSSDAYHISAPSPQGEGAARCMKAALADAGLLPENIDYINAHGTSTKYNDLYETQAIKSVFKDFAYNIPISSTKSMTGHLLGGAGGIETIFSVLTIYQGIIPPTINLDEPDPDCDLDYVPNVARKKNVDFAMSNSFGFGGTNATLILKKFQTN